jgi:hypothetical protein
MKRIKVKWIGLMLRKNCLSKTFIEVKIGGRIEVTERRRRRSRKLLDGLEERSRYWRLKQEALNHALWRTRFKRGYGPVVRDYVKTTTMMTTMRMMVTRPYSRTAINKQSLVRQITTALGSVNYGICMLS